MKMFESMAGVELTPVHYKGVAPMITDVVAGHVPMMFVTVGQTLPLWKEGKLKVLGVGARERVASFPDAPTFSESGLRDWKQTHGSVSMRRKGQRATSSARSMPKPGVLSPRPAFAKRCSCNILVSQWSAPPKNSPTSSSWNMRNGARSFGRPISKLSNRDCRCGGEPILGARAAIVTARLHARGVVA